MVYIYMVYIYMVYIYIWCIYIYIVYYLGFPYIGNVIIPTDELLFFRGVGLPPPPTRYYMYKKSVWPVFNV